MIIINKYIVLFLISFLLLISDINAKTFDSIVSQPIILNGGSKLENYATISEEFVHKLKSISPESVDGVVNIGASEAIYYDNNNTPGNYPDGAYVIKTASGTYTDVNFSVLYKDLLIINDKRYDVKLTVDKVYDEIGGAVAIPSNRLIIALDEYFVNEHNNLNRYRGLDFYIDIYESGTTVKAKIPNLVFGVRGLLGDETYKEGIKIYDFVPNKDNTYIYSYNNGIRYNDGSYYGSKYADVYIYGNGNAFFKIPSLRQNGQLSLSYASTSNSSAILFSFYLPAFNVSYKKEINGEIADIKSEFKFEDEFLSFDESNPDNYKLSYFTCDKDVSIDDQVISSGDRISLLQLQKIKVVDDLVIIAHYENKEYTITTKVEGGQIDESTAVLYGDDKSISYVPKKGYHLEKIIVDGQSIDIKNNETFYTFRNVCEDHVIEVIFEINKYLITTEVEGGFIDDSKEISYGESVTISYYPNENYRLYKVFVDGTEVNSPREYDFVDVEENHNIKVIYEKIPVIEAVKTTDKDNYKENDIVNYTLSLNQKEDGAVAKDVIVIDTLSDELIIDEESLLNNSDIEVLEISNNHFKIKIDNIKDTKLIKYSAKVKEEVSKDELISNTVVEVGNSDDEILLDNKIYIPRGCIEKSIANTSYYYDDIITFTINVSQKTKGATLHNVVLKETLPSELELIGVLGDDLDILKDGNSFKVNIGQIKSEQFLITVKARVKAKEGKIRLVSSLSADEIIYPLEKDISININKPTLKMSKECLSKSLKVSEKAKCIINISGVGARNVSFEDTISDNLELLKSSVKTDGKVIIKNNKLLVSFSNIDSDKKIIYEVKALKKGKCVSESVLRCENCSEMIKRTNIMTIKNINRDKIRDVISTAIPMTGKNKNFLDIIVSLCVTIAILITIVIIRKNSLE